MELVLITRVGVTFLHICVYWVLSRSQHKLLTTYVKYLFYTREYFVCLFIYVLCLLLLPVGGQKKATDPQGLLDSCKLLYRCQQPNLWPLKEQTVLLKATSSPAED